MPRIGDRSNNDAVGSGGGGGWCVFVLKYEPSWAYVYNDSFSYFTTSPHI